MVDSASKSKTPLIIGRGMATTANLVEAMAAFGLMEYFIELHEQVSEPPKGLDD